jgi:tRNA-splicing ligase RtcB
MKRTRDEHAAVLHQWTAAPPPHDVKAALERLRHADDVAHIAVMPDVHLAEEVCVGCVVATRTTLIPAAVGGDIGCGMAAIGLDADAEIIKSDPHAAAAVLTGLASAVPAVSFPERRPLPDDLADRPLSDPTLEAHKRRIAGMQLGTLGRGNHFLELQADDEDRLWLMVHSGSRGLGQAIRDHHDARAERLGGGLRGLLADSPEGAAYLADMQWALDYAARNRELLRERAAEVLWTCLKVQVIATTAFACHHNFVRHETHAGAPLWVHRKGAISAQEGESGVIPGSMGAPSYHVRGRGCAAALCSSSHGAGRQMSRMEARKKISREALLAQMHGVWFDHRAAEALRDEAPGAYKDIGAVMRAQRPLTRVVRTLRPLLCFKGT